MANRQFSQDADGADRFPSGAASQTGFAPRRGQQFDITRTAPAALRHRPPTDEEYTQYLSNLMDIQGFAAGLDDMLTSCTGDGDPELLRDLIANYLAPLRAYQDEIVHIRSRVRSSSDGAPEVLFDLLGEIEPQFQSVVKRLDRLQLTLTGEKPTSPGIPESPPVPEGGNLRLAVLKEFGSLLNVASLRLVLVVLSFCIRIDDMPVGNLANRSRIRCFNAGQVTRDLAVLMLR
jgi:hypothetical protein